MDSFLENAQRIFDVARSAACEGNNDFAQDFALTIQQDGGLHFFMGPPFSIEAVALHTGAKSAYRITRSSDGVRVEGRSEGRDCILQQRDARKMLLQDQPLYRMTSPLLTSARSLD